MENDMMLRAALAMPTLRPFLSRAQLAAIGNLARGEESRFFLNKIIEMSGVVDAMPKTYEQDGKGDQATAHLHYFLRGSDWYITEKDVDGGVQQAFGYAILNGDEEMAELGYISIEEITACGAELDLHFTPCTLAALEIQRNPWAVVIKPGQDDQEVYEVFRTYKAAVAALGLPGEEANVMKRLADGTLTTEY